MDESYEISRIASLLNLQCVKEEIVSDSESEVMRNYQENELSNLEDLSSPNFGSDDLLNHSELSPIRAVCQPMRMSGLFFKGPEFDFDTSFSFEKQSFEHQQSLPIQLVRKKHLYRFNSTRYLKSHPRRSHTRQSLGFGPQFLCRYCPHPVRFHYMQGRQNHENSCSFNTASHDFFTCDQCGKQYLFKGTIKKHFEKKHI